MAPECAKTAQQLRCLTETVERPLCPTMPAWGRPSLGLLRVPPVCPPKGGRGCGCSQPLLEVGLWVGMWAALGRHGCRCIPAIRTTLLLPSPPLCTPMKKRGHRPTEREGYCSWHLMGSICCIPLGCCPGWIGKELAGRLSSVLTTWLGGSRGAWQGQSTGPGNWGLVHVCMHMCVCICMHMCVLGGGEEAEKPHPLLVAAVLLRASAARGCHYTSWQVSASKTVLGSSPSWLSWRWESQLSPVASRVGPCCGIGWPVLLPPP
ncbi:LOW QUALITY PROTEIN: uncharacterized protein [Macaca nemestrina]|uniref:LOW QUALITY PROTEIN: uncharacterized protein n=1 Tax=Macaca nemestrina TaxID=9545 RepID=UPI0039B8D93A